MNDEADLGARVAALEESLSRVAASARPRGLLSRLGCLALATLLTLNAWAAWRSLDTLAAGRIEHHFWMVCQPGATDQQRRDAFTELVKANNREWRSARLDRLTLRSGRFDGAQLELADMEACDFTHSTMAGANLKGAILQAATLVNTDLSFANLAEAFLLKADLTDSKVLQANLRSASLEQAELKNADFESSDLTEANLSMAVLTHANLRNANLSWSNLVAADFRGADLWRANFENAIIYDTDFTDSNWWRAVGLPSGDIDRFQRDFAPTEDAPSDFQEDYLKWLAQE